MTGRRSETGERALQPLVHRSDTEKWDRRRVGNAPRPRSLPPVAREATLGARTNLRGATRAAQNVVGPPEDSLTLVFRAPIFAPRKVGPPRVELYLPRLSGPLPFPRREGFAPPRCCSATLIHSVAKNTVGPPRVELYLPRLSGPLPPFRDFLEDRLVDVGSVPEPFEVTVAETEVRKVQRPNTRRYTLRVYGPSSFICRTDGFFPQVVGQCP